MGSAAPTPFTAPLSASQAKAKQQQLQSLAMRSANPSKYNTNNVNIFPSYVTSFLTKLLSRSHRFVERAVQKLQEQEGKYRQRTCLSQPGYPISPAYCQYGVNHCQALRRSEPSGTDSSASVDVLLGNLSLRASLRSDLLAADHAICQNDCPHGANVQQNFPTEGYSESVQKQTADNYTGQGNAETHHADAQGDGVNVGQHAEKSSHVDETHGDGDCKQSCLSIDYEQEFGEKNSSKKHARLPDWDPKAVERPIENEEWVAFLQSSMEEIMEGEVDSMLQQNCVSVFVSPLRNPAASSRVVEYVACLLSLPFTVTVSKENLEKIKQVYLDVRVVPNLVYATKVLMSVRSENESNTETRPASSLSADELQALEYSMLVLCRLIHEKDQFLMQFCDAIYIVNGMPVLQQLLTLEKRKARVVADLVAILNNILRSQPEYAELVEAVVLRTKTPGERTKNRFT